MHKAPIGNIFLTQLASGKARIGSVAKLNVPDEAPRKTRPETTPMPKNASPGKVARAPAAGAGAPVAPAPQPGNAEERARVEIQHNRVLVIDDDEGFLEEMVETLEAHGFDCLAARDAKYGLDIIQDLGDSLSVVISDVRMPQIDGIELGHALRRRAARDIVPRLILMSGYFTEDMEAQARDIQAAGLLAKPFRPMELVQLVRQAAQASLLERSIRQEADRISAASRELLGTVSHAARRIHMVTRAVDEWPQAPLGALALADGDMLQEGINLFRRLRNARAEALPSGVDSEMHLNLLMELADANESMKPQYVSALALSAGLPLTTTVRLLDALCAEGLCERERDTADSRRTVVRLMPAGREAVARCVEALIT